MLPSASSELSRRDQVKGAVLFEFAIIVPVLLLMVAFLFLLGRLIWQYQLLCDAARHGARTAAIESELYPDKDCSQLKDIAVTAANAYRENNSKRWALDLVWEEATATVGSPIVYKYTPPRGMRIRMMKVTFKTKDSDNCLFCYSDAWRKLSLSATASMDLSYTSMCQGGASEPEE